MKMNQRQTNLRMLLIAAPAIVALMLISKATHREGRWDSGYRPVMGTFSRVVVLAPKGSTARQGAFKVYKLQQRLEDMMSTHRNFTELALVNEQAYGTPMHVSPETMEVLQRSIEMSQLTEGTFDITIGPLLALWQHAADTNITPTPEAIDAAKAKVGWQNLRLDPNALTVEFLVPGMKLDVGGIAKGYAIDKSIELLQADGATGGMVDIGGDIRCFGKGLEHETWRIGIQDPNVDADDMSPNKFLRILSFTDRAVATSGHYRRYALIDGEQVSHIITPSTGSGKHESASTTIIAPDATTADGLATAVSILGPDKGLALVKPPRRYRGPDHSGKTDRPGNAVVQWDVTLHLRPDDRGDPIT